MTEVPPGLAIINKSALTKKERYWQNRYNRCQQSGLRLAGYARSQGLVVKTFYAWHWRLRQRGLVKSAVDAALFHRVKVNPVDRSSTFGLRQKTTPAPLDTKASTTASTEVPGLSLRFKLPNGIDCEVAGLNPGNCTGFMETLARLRP